MSPSQIDAVQASFARVRPIPGGVAAPVRARLFGIAPEVRPLFAGDLTAQGAKPVATRGAVVSWLRDRDAVLPAAEDLARRHVGCGVAAAHCAPVGAALLDVLERGHGDAFTAEARDGRAAASATLSAAMIAAASPDPEIPQ